MPFAAPLFPAFILNCGELWQGIKPEDWGLDIKSDLGSYECVPEGQQVDIYTPAKEIRWKDPVVNTRWNELKQAYSQLYPYDDTSQMNIAAKRVWLQRRGAGPQ